MAGEGDEKKRFKIPTFVYNPYHINLWAGDYLNLRQKYPAAIKQYNSGEGNANLDREMIPIYEGRSKAFLHTWNLKNTERDVFEGLQLQTDNTGLMLTLGDLLYQKNQFEDALGAYYRGHWKKPRPPKFMHGILASTGTVLNSLGSKVGNIMSSKRLGGIVKKLKMRELGQSHAVHGNNEIARRRKLIKVNRIKEAYETIYLNRAAIDKRLLQSCLDKGTLFLANKKQNAMLKKTLENAIRKLNAAQIALWRRQPLYTREHDVMSKRVKIFNSKKQDLKKADLEIVVNLRIAALDQAFNQNKYVDCFKYGDDLRTFLFEQSDHDLPSKKDALITVISILGDLFLKNKRLLPISPTENDERILIIFGFKKPHKLSHEYYSEEAFHPPIIGLKRFIDSKLFDLRHTTEPLEKAYLCHEIGIANSFKGIPFVTKKYAREAIFASKAAKDRKWLLNSLFLLTRSEIQQGNMTQGRVSLNGLMAAAEKFQFPDLKYLAIRAYELTGMKDIQTTATGFEQFENKILGAMCTEEYMITALKFIQKARAKPKEKRFPSSREGAKGDIEDLSEQEEEQNVYYQALTEAKRRGTLVVNDNF